MPFEGQARGPIGVGASRPGRLAPARVHEIDRVGDVLVTEHLAQNGEDLELGTLVGLGFDASRLVGHDGSEEDSGAGEKIREVERLEDRVVATLWGGVEEVLIAGIPENAVGRKLEEDFGVDAHLEGFDRDAFPLWKWRVKSHQVGLKYTN